MAPRIAPPSRNAAAQALLELYQSTERRIIQEIARKRTQGYVDYAELAALRRVRKTIQQMVDKSAKYVPLAIEHEFYKGKEARKGYENALGMTEGTAERDRVAEQLVDNLMGEVQEMAQTAYQSAEAQVLGRTAPDVYRQSVLRGAVVSETMGRGSLSTVEEVMRSLQQAGITAFVDKAGREWSLSAYGAMAVRTTVRQAQVSAVLTADDHDLWKIKEIGSTCPLCAVYEGRVYSKSGMNPNYPPLAAAFGKMDPAGPNDLSNTFLNIHPNCLVPGGLVLAEGLVSESRRPYDGEVITLETSSGNRITVTPNHPVLTDRGFIAAGLLEEGQKIIEASGKYTGLFGEAPNDINTPTGLEEIFHSLMSSGGGAACSVVGSAEQFHGDGVPDSKVDIVFADGSGVSKRDPAFSQKPAENDLPTGHLWRPVLFSKGSLAEIFIRALSSFYSRVSCSGFVCGIKGISENGKDLPYLRHGATAGFSNLSERQPGFMEFKEMTKKFRMFGSELFGNIAKALVPGSLGKDHAKVMLGVLDSPRVEIKFPGDVCASEPLLVARLQELLRDDGLVVSVLTHKSTSSYSGFVYNLETKYGYYVYNNIVTHNCLHSLVKWTEDYKTDEEIRQAREFSSFETNPKTNDPRTEKQIEAYRNKERQRAAYRRDVKQFERYTRAGIEDFPRSMATFLKHKQADDDTYKAWMAEYRKRGK